MLDRACESLEHGRLTTETGDTLMGRIAHCTLTLVAIIGVSAGVARGQIPAEQAWQELPHYQYGQDLAGPLMVERNVIEAMNTPARRAEIAARWPSC